MYDHEEQLVDGILEGPENEVMSLFGSINADPRYEVDFYSYSGTAIACRQYEGLGMALVMMKTQSQKHRMTMLAQERETESDEQLNCADAMPVNMQGGAIAVDKATTLNGTCIVCSRR